VIFLFYFVGFFFVLKLLFRAASKFRFRKFRAASKFRFRKFCFEAASKFRFRKFRFTFRAT
jgi:hypothetical protein